MSSHLTTREYENIANDTMDRLHENLEIYVEEYGPEGSGAWEVEYSVRHRRPLVHVHADES
jgi:hypothetical protein